ncbi:MAG TPA: class I SAM-dependent methyltransferase [Mycobacteriales bacterium]|nr:class I SAM-dependent methyltransferase [Mycobacteriales bacterium]
MAVLPRVPALAWDHNAYYHRLILRRLPAGSQRVLDVGCGAGALAARLALRVRRVEAVDRSPAMVDRARAATGPRVTVRRADVLSDPLPEGAYDAVVCLSVLHHLPLDEALPRLAAALRPGGRLVAVALPRVDLPRELPVEVAAAGAQAAVAVTLGLARLAGLTALAKDDAHMPVAAPELTVRQVRAQARAVLPGVRVRRLLFWRYLLEWDRPADSAA